MKENISILVPAYNEEKNIKRCLESIAVQRLPLGITMEVVIIPNGCTDKTVKIARTFIKSKRAQKNKQINWKIIVLKDGHKAKALNAGGKEAKTDIIFCVDSDCYLAKGALNKIYQKVNNNEKIKVFGGLSLSDFSGREKNNLLYQCQRTYDIRRELGSPTITIGAFMGFRKKFIPPFPITTASDDTWLTLYSGKKYGYKSVLIVKDSVVYYFSPKNWEDYIKQLVRFRQATHHLIGRYKEFRPILKEFADRSVKMRDQRIDEETVARLKKEKIPAEMLVYWKKFFNPMIQEYSESVDYGSAFDKGKWESIKSTKYK